MLALNPSVDSKGAALGAERRIRVEVYLLCVCFFELLAVCATGSV